MKQAILYGAGDLRIEERPLDASSLAPGEIYVETEVSALSTGTDLGNYEGRSQEIPGAPAYPRAVGYSNVGRLSNGTRVFSMKPHMSAFIATPADMLVPVPENVDSEQASLAYLTQLGVAALQQARFQPGEQVAVVGLGVIGLCTVAIARAMGAHVTAVANSTLRADAAARVGAHGVCMAGSDAAPAGIDLVVLTANSWQAYRESVEMARHSGRISILGFPGRAADPPAFNPLDPQWFYGKQLTLIGAGFAASDQRRRNLEMILGHMSTGAVDLRPVITHRLPAERMKEAYELARAHAKELIAAVFHW